MSGNGHGSNSDLRGFTASELVLLSQRLDKTWAAMRAHGCPEVSWAGLLSGFGDWRRVAPETHEPMQRLTALILHAPTSGEYAVLRLPYRGADTPAGEGDRSTLLAAARDAVVGGPLSVWRWTLREGAVLEKVAMVFVTRFASLPESERFLAAFTMVEETYRAAATPTRSALLPMRYSVQEKVDRAFWEAGTAVRDRIVDWAMEEARRWVESVPSRVMATDDGSLALEVDHLIEVFVDEQRDFDPTASRRVSFVWSSPPE